MTSIPLVRALASAGVVALYLAMCAVIVWRERRKREAVRREAAALAPAGGGDVPWLVAHGSQTGTAEEIAWQTGRALHAAGVPARVLALSEVDAATLASATHLLVVASTYGEGDPPDNASLFARQVLGQPLALSHLKTAVLALGDRGYANFCGFGRAVEAWLAAQGAQPLFARIDVDGGDRSALTSWQQQLGHGAGTRDLAEWQAPAFGTWRLTASTHLNPGSSGGPAFRLALEPVDAPLPSWEAGDLAQIEMPQDTAHPREYSIASVPGEGRIELLVRQQRREDGSLGLASGWLTSQASIGQTVAMRLRAHGNFRLGENASRPMVLIGNGTGLAGLRAHLKARVAVSGTRQWLLFGERQAAHDRHFGDEIDAWQRAGLLERVDWVFSRDGAGARYVQDRLRECAQTLRAWLDDGAAVYVCGSLEGMAGGVDAALVEIVGQAAVDRLLAQGRYRRDVY